MKKRTIRKEIGFSGVGVHTGRPVEMVLRPSDSGEWIFRRRDLGGLEARLDPGMVEARNSSSLIGESFSVRTLEHLLAVLHVFGVDSLVIDLDGEEIPFMDGSASPFAQAVLESGIAPLPLPKKKRALRITRSFIIKEGDSSISFSPDPDFRISYAVEFAHPAIGRQELDLKLSLRDFLTGVAPARTFGFLKDVPRLRKEGLALGGSMNNAIVLDDERVINGPLRFPDEFVRHKTLDLIGDLALLGSPLLGHVEAERAGHSLHVQAVRFLLNNPEFWMEEDHLYPSHLNF